jgi:hypothetical protein
VGGLFAQENGVGRGMLGSGAESPGKAMEVIVSERHKKHQHTINLQKRKRKGRRKRYYLYKH